MTHGHELRVRGIAGGKKGTGERGEREKNWDNCNRIINKIYFKKVKKRERKRERITLSL